MSVRHSWSAGVDPRPDFPTTVHGRRVREDRGGPRARLIVPRPAGEPIEIAGALAHYRMADGADDIEFTGQEMDLELLCDGEGEWAWLRLSHFHRTERHGLSWLRHRLLSARVRLSAGWLEGHPAWSCHADDGQLVAQLVVEAPLVPGPGGSEGRAGLAGMLADFLDGPPPAEPEPA